MTELLNTETGELVELDQVAARRLTDKIKVGVEGVWLLIEQAYTSRAWQALGYSSWDDYCTREFGTSRLRLPREDRPEVVASLRESGLSLRAISAATGHDVKTIRADIAGVGNSHTSQIADVTQIESPVTGTDGKTYPAKPKYPAKPQRRPALPDQVMRASYKLRKKAESVAHLFEDDRLAQNKEQISLLSRSDLLYVQRVVAAALEQLPITEG